MGVSKREQQRVGAKREMSGELVSWGGIEGQTSAPPTPEIGFMLNPNKCLSHKSQQLQ